MANERMPSMGAAGAVELFRKVPFLRNAPAEELEVLAERSIRRHFDAADDIIVQGEFGHSMFVLLRGRVEIFAHSEAGQKLDIAEVDQPGAFFGEGALLGRGVRSATIRADADTDLIEIERNPFDILARRFKDARTQLESSYHARMISTYTRLHRYLGQLDENTLRRLFSSAYLQKVQRNEVVCKAGDPADSVMVIKDGVLKAVREGSDQKRSILAYFNTADIAGVHDGMIRDYGLVAMGQAEIIHFDRRAFGALEESHPAIFERFGKDDMRRRGAVEAASTTMVNVAQAFLSEGVEVESLLVIDMDTCVRCGNCVRACHDRHEFTRLDRRGPIFRRRAEVTGNKYQHVMLPSSCRHCRDPECMIGCPTGAIQRFPNGDVDINDNCIGCDNCARKCPYGNITMRPLKPEEIKDEVTKRAIKCNLCRGHEYSNCVHECPTGAIIRVDPLRYFDELTMVMEPEHIEVIKRQNEKAKDHDKQRIRPRSRAFILYSFIFLALGLLGSIAAYLAAPEPLSGGSSWGLGFGVAGAVCVLAAMVQGARKRTRTRAIGHLQGWVQFHMVIGALGFFLALAHTGFAITGVFTTLLLLVFALQVGSGFAGQLVTMNVPRIITRLERHGNAKLVEDLIEEEGDLQRGIDELQASLPEQARTFLDQNRKAIEGTFLERCKDDYDTERKIASAKNVVARSQSLLDRHDTVARLFADTIKLGDVRAQLHLHQSLRVWLAIHLAFTGALAVFLGAHIAMNLLFLL